ncbi:hypothetical protein Fcan01_11729 [Folsomia candida]|uniref:Uncharacterized protein n=2 Tax=Folsomia candida TaxID=158441 RepID=A0A226EBP2_FOLCA|nr:hypothetical protein Fcan01_11729 [Folsomia candida]
MTTPRLVVLLILSFTLATNASLLEEIIRNGTKLEWTYFRDVDDEHTTTEDWAPTEDDFTTTVPTTPRPEMLLTVFRTDTSQYVTVEGNVLTAGNPQTIFTLIPVSEGGNQFHLFQDGETFVAPRTRAPFEFVRHSQFPSEPPAVFSLEPYQFYLNSSYGGQRSRIWGTLQEIERLPAQSERLVAYRDLIEQMNAFNHILGGTEAFQVGDSIRRSIPGYVDTLPFIMLPEQVQLVTQSASEDFLLKLSVVDPTGNVIPVNEHLAYLQPWPLYPFTFSGNLVKSGSGQYWVLDTSNNLRSNIAPPSTTFIPHFSANTTESFIVSTSYNWFLAFVGVNATSRSFRSYSNSQERAAFIVSHYQVDVAEMYGGQNKSLGPEVAHIIKKYSPTPELGGKFEQLLTSVEENGHIYGKEIFSIGAIMTQAPISNDHPAFTKLPEMVRVILTRNTSLTYQDQISGVRYPMKYSWASDLHQGVESYSFRISPPPLANETFASAKFCIVYGFGGEVQPQRVFINPTTKLLTQELLNGLVYDLELDISQGLDLVNLSWNNTRVVTSNMQPDFYFQAGNQFQSANFIVREFI